MKVETKETRTYTLTLTEQEAQFLTELAASVAGGPDTPARLFVDALVRELPTWHVDVFDGMVTATGAKVKVCE